MSTHYSRHYSRRELRMQWSTVLNAALKSRQIAKSNLIEQTQYVGTDPEKRLLFTINRIHVPTLLNIWLKTNNIKGRRGRLQLSNYIQGIVIGSKELKQLVEIRRERSSVESAMDCLIATILSTKNLKNLYNSHKVEDSACRIKTNIKQSPTQKTRMINRSVYK